ncbi:methyl-accepting chemotaxis protein [Mangrovibacter sp. SLW1]
MKIKLITALLPQRFHFRGMGLLSGIVCVIGLFLLVQVISTTGLGLLLNQVRAQVTQQGVEQNAQRQMDEARIGLLTASDLVNRAGIWFMQDKETGSVGSWNSLADDAASALNTSQQAFEQFRYQAPPTAQNKAVIQSYLQFYAGLKEQVDSLRKTQSIDSFFAVPVQAFQAQFNQDFAQYKTESDRLRQQGDNMLLAGLNQMQTRSLSALLVVLVVAIFTGAGLLFWVIRPLNRLLQHLDQLADGDLSVLPATPVRVNREVYELWQRLMAMQQGLRQVVNAVHSATDNMAGQIAAMNDENQVLSAQATEQSHMLTKVTDGIRQLSGSVDENTRFAGIANQRADEARDIARGGDAMMLAVNNSMQAIEGRSDEMRGIVAMIETVAFQTNILALNAAIEAAHAGNHGRGFAVVAKEVGILARKSAHSTQTIQQLINHSLEGISQGAGAVARLEQNLASVTQLVTAMTVLLNDIAAASLHQGENIQRVTGQITALDDVASRTASLVQQSQLGVRRLYEGQQQLTTAVARFRLA